MLKHKLVNSWRAVRRSVNSTFAPRMLSRPRISPRSARPQSAKKRPYLHQFSQSPLAIFTRELLTNPRAVGAACPSSVQLARAMARHVDPDTQGLVLELGAGTGRVTEALLARGIAPERLIVVERSEKLVHHLHKRFPQLRVIEGDACQLKKLLGKDFQHISHVVSSLPLRSLPRPVVHGITAQLDRLLLQDAVLIQFTYDLSGKGLVRLGNTPAKRFIRVSSQIIWQNLPPARVDVFRQRAS